MSTDAVRWAKVPRHPGLLVSDHGHLMTQQDGKWVPAKVSTNAAGYSRPSGSGTLLHLTVIRRFQGSRPGMHVSHINGCPCDFRLSNLEYVTPQQNSDMCQVHHWWVPSAREEHAASRAIKAGQSPAKKMPSLEVRLTIRECAIRWGCTDLEAIDRIADRPELPPVTEADCAPGEWAAERERREDQIRWGRTYRAAMADLRAIIEREPTPMDADPPKRRKGGPQPGSGRPRVAAEPLVQMNSALPQPTVDAVNRYRFRHGISRNAAVRRLLEIAFEALGEPLPPTSEHIDDGDKESGSESLP